MDEIQGQGAESLGTRLGTGKDENRPEAVVAVSPAEEAVVVEDGVECELLDESAIAALDSSAEVRVSSSSRHLMILL